jgi:hypothetical protein
MSNYEAKQQAKRDRYADRADKARAEAESKLSSARRTASFIPMGQPILVGHHSERKHRRDLANINRQEDQALEALDKAKHYERKAESYGTHTISSDDPEAISKLQAKLARLETQREDIKEANKAARESGRDKAPAYVLQNLGGTIRQVRDRIKELESKREATPAPAVEGDGFRVEECAESNRIRFFFEGRPSAEIRKIMKSNGFKWAPSVGAWQRQTTDYARHSARDCQRAIAALKGDA